MTSAVQHKLSVDLLRRQDPTEFTRFVGVYQTVIFGLGQSMGLSGADCDDLAAETFAIAYRAFPTFRGEAEIATWLYRIGYRTAIKVRRRYSPGPQLSEETADTSEPGPMQVFEAKETSEAVWRGGAVGSGPGRGGGIVLSAWDGSGGGGGYHGEARGNGEDVVVSGAGAVEDVAEAYGEGVMTMNEEEMFDGFLRGAMAARPEHVARMDIVAAAMERVRVREAQMLKLAQVARWTRFVSVAAGVLIVVTIGVGYWMWPAAVTSATTTATAYTTSTATTSLDFTAVGVVALIGTGVWLAMMMVFASDRQGMRLAVG